MSNVFWITGLSAAGKTTILYKLKLSLELVNYSDYIPFVSVILIPVNDL